MGHKVTIFTAWHQNDHSKIAERLPGSVRIESVAQGPSGPVARYARTAFWVVKNRKNLSSFDIIHCHLTFGSFVGFLMAMARKGPPQATPCIVETYHAVGMPISPIIRWTHARMASSRDVLVLMAHDRYWTSFAQTHPKVTVRTILNGADDPGVGSVTESDRQAYRRSLGILDKTRFVVGTVGVLRRDRQPWKYLPIFSDLAEKFGPEIHFVIAGGGPERKRLESLLATRELSKQVHITGPIPNPRVALSVMDLYLTLNVGSVTGLAAIEAALAGVPVVAIQMLSSYRGSENDWIWSSPDLPEVSRRAEELLRSDSARHLVGTQQQAYARANHTVDAMCRSYQRLYSEIMERSSRFLDGHLLWPIKKH
ncbi:MAG: glycosyltransferase family 4 protein [Gemmatimonadota bacterium]|nr:glycosyltransferase family 4 protein [Gemmatimonadota bacterium]